MTSECRNRHVDHGAQCQCDKTTPNHKLCSGWSDHAGGFIDWENPSYEQPVTTDKASAKETLRNLAEKVSGHDAAREGSEKAAKGWSTAQRLLVESAITQAAQENAEFTTDQVWAILGDRVPKTAGMAAMLSAAAKNGFISLTERYADSQRADRADHDQGRRLRVWRSLMS
jgi:hypothetical protein